MEQPVPSKICVLYDPRDGRVVHTHRVITMPGGQEITDAEAEARAKERAKQAGRDIRGLSALRVAHEDCDGSSQYRVDLAEKKLRKLERPPVLSAYDLRVLADGPVLYLLLSGGSAGAADRSGSGFSATTVGAPAITTFPNGDNATQFDGATQYLEVASNDSLSVATTGVLTLEAWIRPDTLQFTNSEGTGYVYWLGKNTPGQSES